MSEEKVSNVTKRNGLGVDPMQRLASIRPPRDYSLGPSKPIKKVFTPNLNVTRNKNKGPSNNVREKKEDRGRKERKNERRFNGPKIVKSSGVFSEGLGRAEINYNRSSFGREKDSTPAVLQRPVIRVKDVVKIDKQLEAEKIKALMAHVQTGADGGAESGDGEEFLRNDKQGPVRLPMGDISLSYGKTKSRFRIKKEPIVKTEPPDVDSNVPSLLENLEIKSDVDIKPDLKVEMESYDDNDVADILQNERSTLMLIKLPDSLPARGGGQDDGVRHKPAPAQPASGATQKENASVNGKCRLLDLQEGRIGKLRVHRSGRVTLQLGDNNFEVSMGTKSSFKQQVVSVAADRASRSARIISLGALQHKLTAVPDWDTMFPAWENLPS